jgi:YD repeat-containing protein
MVINRIVSSDGTSSSEQVWTYAATEIRTGLNLFKTMTVTDPLGNSQVFTRPDGSPLSSQIDFKDSNGRVVKTVLNDLESGGEPQYQYDLASFSNTRSKAQTTILPTTNQQSRITYTYATFNHVTEMDQTDWGSGAPGAILTKSTFTYLTDSNPPYAADTVHILDRVTSERICDSGATFCSQTTTSYDSTSLTPTSGVGQHDYANFSTSNTLRGNPTKVSRFLNVTNTNLDTTRTYNDVGNLTQIVDPAGNLTSFSFNDNYYNFTPAKLTSAFVTQVTEPTTNGVNHIRKTQYYFNSGLPAATCGENFPSSAQCAVGLTLPQPDYATFSYDALNRPTYLTHGDGGQTTLTYNEAAPPFSTTSTTAISSGKNLVNTTVYDGLGRAKQVQLNSDPGNSVYGHNIRCAGTQRDCQQSVSLH